MEQYNSNNIVFNSKDPLSIKKDKVQFHKEKEQIIQKYKQDHQKNLSINLNAINEARHKFKEKNLDSLNMNQINPSLLKLQTKLTLLDKFAKKELKVQKHLPDIQLTKDLKKSLVNDNIKSIKDDNKNIRVISKSTNYNCNNSLKQSYTNAKIDFDLVSKNKPDIVADVIINNKKIDDDENNSKNQDKNKKSNKINFQQSSLNQIINPTENPYENTNLESYNKEILSNYKYFENLRGFNPNDNLIEYGYFNSELDKKKLGNLIQKVYDKKNLNYHKNNIINIDTYEGFKNPIESFNAVSTNNFLMESYNNTMNILAKTKKDQMSTNIKHYNEKLKSQDKNIKVSVIYTKQIDISENNDTAQSEFHTLNTYENVSKYKGGTTMTKLANSSKRENEILTTAGNNEVFRRKSIKESRKDTIDLSSSYTKLKEKGKLTDGNDEDKNNRKTSYLPAYMPNSNYEVNLFAYYLYPKVNFPEARENASIVFNLNKAYLYGGNDSLMKNKIWEFNPGIFLLKILLNGKRYNLRIFRVDQNRDKVILVVFIIISFIFTVEKQKMVNTILLET